MFSKEPIRVLVAQDVPIFFRFLEMKAHMAELPFVFELVTDGQMAVDKIQEGNDYDAILMNIEMPWKNGIEATLEIRELGYKKPIIAWSAHSRSWMWEDCKKAGMNEYIESFYQTMIEDLVIAFSLCGVVEWEPSS